MNSLNIRGAVDQLSQPQTKDAKLMIGTIASGASGKVVVSFAGGGSIECRYVAGYTPTISDKVQVLCTGPGMYMVLGKLSADQTATPVTTETINPVATWGGWYGKAFMSVDNEWFDSTPGQGKGGGWLSTVERRYGLWRFDPDFWTGKTILALSLIISRPTASGWFGDDANFRAPRLYRHSHSSRPAGAPTWDSSVWSPGQIYSGQSATFPLPSGWITAFGTGASTGVGVDSSAAGDYAMFDSCRLLVTYV